MEKSKKPRRRKPKEPWREKNNKKKQAKLMGLQQNYSFSCSNDNTSHEEVRQFLEQFRSMGVPVSTIARFAVKILKNKYQDNYQDLAVQAVKYDVMGKP